MVLIKWGHEWPVSTDCTEVCDCPSHCTDKLWTQDRSIQQPLCLLELSRTALLGGKVRVSMAKVWAWRYGIWWLHNTSVTSTCCPMMFPPWLSWAAAVSLTRHHKHHHLPKHYHLQGWPLEQIRCHYVYIITHFHRYQSSIHCISYYIYCDIL